MNIIRATLTSVAIVFVAIVLSGCSKVPAGNVGVKVYLLGGSKGVDSEVLGAGRYWIGVNEELYLFPTFTQTTVWTKNPTEGSENDESVTFQTIEGLSVNADIGVSYHCQADKIGLIFQKYRRGIDEITDVYLRNMVRDAFVTVASTMPVESVYGKGKADMIKKVQNLVREQTVPIGIEIERIYYNGDLRLPVQVVNALNKKIEATQRAEQRENELREARADAAKAVAAADGEAQSKLRIAKAEAEANRIIAQSITPELVKYMSIQRWDGKLPKLTGSAIPLIDIAELDGKSE